jgi:DNA modification methylase
MVSMWDDAFVAMDPGITELLAGGAGGSAWERMHGLLDEVWAECHRVLCPGGLACVNVGDATRSLGGRFQLFPNHARVVSGMARLGFTVLPDVLWHKPTNAPNKFMGSGMLPAGAYVTYEHEYVLVFRKGNPRAFDTAEARRDRARSAYFWEERNAWFSDLWTALPGTRQGLGPRAGRERSAAFPFELPWRLIRMYSAYGDTVLDPFAGTGTTLAAAVAAGRSSVGVEVDASLAPLAQEALAQAVAEGPAVQRARLRAHAAFVEQRLAAGAAVRHVNEPHGVPVITAQERLLELWEPAGLRRLPDGGAEVEHRLVAGESAPPRAAGGLRQQRLFGVG